MITNIPPMTLMNVILISLLIGGCLFGAGMENESVWQKVVGTLFSLLGVTCLAVMTVSLERLI